MYELKLNAFSRREIRSPFLRRFARPTASFQSTHHVIHMLDQHYASDVNDVTGVGDALFSGHIGEADILRSTRAAKNFLTMAGHVATLQECALNAIEVRFVGSAKNGKCYLLEELFDVNLNVSSTIGTHTITSIHSQSYPVPNSAVSAVISFADTPGINDLNPDVSMMMADTFAVCSVAIYVISCGASIKPDDDMVKRMQTLKEHCRANVLVCLTMLDRNTEFNPAFYDKEQLNTKLEDLRTRFAAPEALNMAKERIALVSLGGPRIRARPEWDGARHSILRECGVMDGIELRRWISKQLIELQLSPKDFVIKLP